MRWAHPSSNAINTRIIDGPRRRYGIIAAGKAAMDALQALSEMGLSKARAADLGISMRTVEVYRANVMSKTRANGLSELVRIALLAGF